MKTRLIALIALVPLVAGCSSLILGSNPEQMRRGASSSLVDYLYPDGEVPPKLVEKMPHLDLPLRVGIAFVPSNGYEDATAIQKQRVLDQVAEAFRDRPYVDAIEAIPDNYMRSAHGITGMRQVSALYDLDVIALVSYDQVSFTSENESALLYWTVVGTLFVKGNHNEVQTMVDTAVFDPATARLLFRAPGMYREEENSTLMNADIDDRLLKEKGFAAATETMITNLDQELDGFRAAVKEGDRATVAWREGSGGGSMTVPLLGLLFLMMIWHNSRRRT
ncbi:MAG: rhombotarget lipoprotein [Pseudomonadota bacterium]